MVCAGGNHGSASACCLSREEYEYTTTNKGYEAAWLAASHKRPQILTSRYFVGSQLTGLFCHPNRHHHHHHHHQHHRAEDIFSFPSSKRECTNAARYLRVYPVATIPELKTMERTTIWHHLSWTMVYIDRKISGERERGKKKKYLYMYIYIYIYMSWVLRRFICTKEEKRKEIRQSWGWSLQFYIYKNARESIYKEKTSDLHEFNYDIINFSLFEIV